MVCGACGFFDPPKDDSTEGECCFDPPKVLAIDSEDGNIIQSAAIVAVDRPACQHFKIREKALRPEAIQ